MGMSEQYSEEDWVANNDGYQNIEFALQEAQRFLLGISGSVPAVRRNIDHIQQGDRRVIAVSLADVLREDSLGTMKIDTEAYRLNATVQEDCMADSDACDSLPGDAPAMEWPASFGGVSNWELDADDPVDLGDFPGDMYRPLELHGRLAQPVVADYILGLYHPTFVPPMQNARKGFPAGMMGLLELARYYEGDIDEHRYFHRYLCLFLAHCLGSREAELQMLEVEELESETNGIVPDIGQGRFDLEQVQNHAVALWRMALAQNPGMKRNRYSHE